MARRPINRVLLPRARRGFSRSVRRLHPIDHKRALKRAAMRDCSGRCVYCGAALGMHDATLDHVYPLAHGGANAAGNVVAACGPCNRLKGDLLPQEFFVRYPWAGLNFMRYARTVHRALKRGARRAVSLAMAA